MGTGPPGESGWVQAETTVASVGPYELISLRPGAHRSTSSGGHASPPTITVRNSASPWAACAGTVARAVGGINAWVTRSSASTVASCSPSNGPAGGTTNAAPAGKHRHSSSTDASKLGEENCRTRSPARTAYRAISAAEKLANPVCVTIRPFGQAGDPDV